MPLCRSLFSAIPAVLSRALFCGALVLGLSSRNARLPTLSVARSSFYSQHAFSCDSWLFTFVANATLLETTSAVLGCIGREIYSVFWQAPRIASRQSLACPGLSSMYAANVLRKRWSWRYVRKNVRRMSERMAEKMAERMSDRMSEHMSERMAEDMSEDTSDKMSESMSDNMPGDMSERVSQDMSDRMSEDMSERMPKDMSERMSEDCLQSVCEVESNRTHFRRWVVCLPSPDKIRLTWNLTRLFWNAMVGITRSKVILFCIFLPWPVFQDFWNIVFCFL